MRSRHRIGHRFLVPGAERSQVNHFGGNVFVRQAIRRFKRDVSHGPISDEGDVRSFTKYERSAKVGGLHGLGRFAFKIIKAFMFKKNDGIVVADRGHEQGLGVGRRGGINDFESGRMRKDRLQTMAVLGAQLVPAAARHADRHRQGCLPAEHVAHHGKMVEDLVHRDIGEVDGHQFRHWPQLAEGRAGGETDDGRFGDGRVEDALRPELLEQTARHLERALIFGHILPKDHDGFVALHLLEERLVDGVAIADLWHGFFSPRIRPRKDDLSKVRFPIRHRRRPRRESFLSSHQRP